MKKKKQTIVTTQIRILCPKQYRMTVNLFVAVIRFNHNAQLLNHAIGT